MNIWKKLKKKGFKGSLQAFGRYIQGHFLGTGYEIDYIRPLCEGILSKKGSITLIEVGANVGATASDPFYQFIQAHFKSNQQNGNSNIKAVLIEPVPELYQQLAANYANCKGVKCLNLAIADRVGTKTFYHFRGGIDIKALGLPSFAHQLGSFDIKNIEAACPAFLDKKSKLDFWQKNVVVSEIPCKSLNDVVVSERLLNIDVLVIDAEGYDYEILKAINFSISSPEYVNYERTHLGKNQAACRRLMIRNGYSLFDHNDDTLCKKDGHRNLWIKLKDEVYNIWLDLIFEKEDK